MAVGVRSLTQSGHVQAWVPPIGGQGLCCPLYTQLTAILREVSLYLPFHRWGSWGPGCTWNWTNVPQPEREESSRMQTQGSLFPNLQQSQFPPPFLVLKLQDNWWAPAGEGHGNPLQYSCLENSMDRGAWWATAYGVTKSRTRLSH